MKCNGSKGKPISQKVFDRAEAYDSYFCNLIEQLQEHCVAAAAEARGEVYPEPCELIPLDPKFSNQERSE